MAGEAESTRSTVEKTPLSFLPQTARELYHKGVRTGGQGTPEGDGRSRCGERRAFRTGSDRLGGRSGPSKAQQLRGLLVSRFFGTKCSWAGARAGDTAFRVLSEGRRGGRHCPRSHLPVGPPPFKARTQRPAETEWVWLPASCPSLCVTVKVYVFDD